MSTDRAPPAKPQTLTVALGFDGELRLLYPNGKSLDLPKGEAEARIREILQGFAKPYREYKKEVAEAIYTEMPPIQRLGKPIKLARPLTLKELGLGE